MSVLARFSSLWPTTRLEKRIHAAQARLKDGPVGCKHAAERGGYTAR